MVTRQYDVMVAYRTGEEIICLTLVGELYHLLGTTEVGLSLTPHQLSLGDKAARKVTRYLEDCDGPLLHISSDTHSYARLEMGVELVAFHHIKWNGTMCKQHLARLRIDGGGIRLESADTQRRLDYHHRQHGWHIALTACHDTLAVQTGKCHAASIVNSRQQVEAAKRETLQAVFVDNTP